MRHRRAPLAALLAAVMTAGVLPAIPVAARDEPVYHLPAREGASLEVKQGNDDELGRVDGQEHAFDFVAADGPERFEVVAARGGTVIGARSGVVGGRCDEPLDGPRPTCWRDVNYVLIDHGDGTSALYTHLKRDTFEVSTGQVVSTGQALATAGRSGWTDEVSLGFQVQETPTWDARGRGGWFQTTSLPVSFADADVIAQRSDGVPRTGDVVVSGNALPLREPFRFRTRPSALPASVPFADGVERDLASAYDADSPDGYGLHFAASAGVTTEVQPVFGGEVVFAGCAAGSSAPLGQSVAVRFDLEDASFLAVHSHLTSIEPSLLEADGQDAPRIVGPNDTIGTYGVADLDETATAAAACPDAADVDELFVTILRNGEITSDGEITGGTPVSPEPLIGERGYEGLAWWSGPLTATEVAARPGRPSVRWNDKTPATGTHIAYGQPIALKARVRDPADIAQVRFRAWYPRWPQVEPSRALTSFDPDASWREIAVCEAPGQETGVGNLCQWQGDGQDARVTYVWDPTVAKRQPSAPWLPRARPAISESSTACVPVFLTVEVIDTAGHVTSGMRQVADPVRQCDAQGDDDNGGNLRILYLDPLVPPRAPASRGTEDRGWPPVYGPDPLKGAIVWRDRSNNEDGFRIYARRHWFEADCSVAKGPWQLVTTTVPNKERYRPKHGQVVDALPVPPDTGAPGTLNYWEYSVSAFNVAGETGKVPVGGFLGGSEAFCDPGVGPPPELEG